MEQMEQITEEQKKAFEKFFKIHYDQLFTYPSKFIVKDYELFFNHGEILCNNLPELFKKYKGLLKFSNTPEGKKLLEVIYQEEEILDAGADAYSGSIKRWKQLVDCFYKMCLDTLQNNEEYSKYVKKEKKVLTIFSMTELANKLIKTASDSNTNPRNPNYDYISDKQYTEFVKDFYTKVKELEKNYDTYYEDFEKSEEKHFAKYLDNIIYKSENSDEKN